jgi:hypothetical protein
MYNTIHLSRASLLQETSTIITSSWHHCVLAAIVCRYAHMREGSCPEVCHAHAFCSSRILAVLTEKAAGWKRLKVLVLGQDANDYQVMGWIHSTCALLNWEEQPVFVSPWETVLLLVDDMGQWDVKMFQLLPLVAYYGRKNKPTTTGECCWVIWYIWCVCVLSNLNWVGSRVILIF